MNKKMTRTPNELLREFENQRAALRASSQGFDSGDDWEARRIATTICTMLYDSGRTTSLLSQMGMKNGLLFLSTNCPNPPGNLTAWHPLTSIQITVGNGVVVSRHKPKLDEPIGKWLLRFEEWWNETVYTNGDRKLTRSTLLRTLRDQEGGAHFDPTVSDPAYIDLKTGRAWRQVVSIGGIESEQPISQAELATARQIAYEVEHSVANSDDIYNRIFRFTTELNFEL